MAPLLMIQNAPQDKKQMHTRPDETRTNKMKKCNAYVYYIIFIYIVTQAVPYDLEKSKVSPNHINCIFIGEHDNKHQSIENSSKWNC